MLCRFVPALILLLSLVISAFAVTREEFVYAQTPQGPLKLTVFYPAGWKATDRRPAALFFFGGGFKNGSPRQFFSKAGYLASRGMVAISAEYRVESRHQTTPAESLADCRTAVGWLREHAAEQGVDETKIVGAGGSAGAACILAAWNKDVPAAQRPNRMVLFNPAFYPNMIDAPVAGLPPVLLFYGTDDPWYKGGQEYWQQANALKLPVQLLFAPGQKHGFFNDRPPEDTAYHAATSWEMDAFLIRQGYLTGKPSITQPAGSRAALYPEDLKLWKPSPRMPLPADVDAHYDLTYGKPGNRPLLLDLYVPKAPASRPRPLVVWIHGGAWQNGDKAQHPAASFLAHGFAVASIQYRFSQEAIWPAQLEDCRAALSWLRAQSSKYNVDANRIGLWGASAGGHLAAMLAMQPGEKVQAVADWFGPTWFTRLQQYPSHMDHEGPTAPGNRLVGAILQQNPELVKATSPLPLVRPGLPPFLIQHGDADELVPLEQSELLADALTKAGNRVTFEVIHRGGHGGKLFLNQANFDRVRQFFTQTLQP